MADRSDREVKRALALDGDAAKIKDFYRGWAARYNDDVGNEGYRAPEVITALVALCHSAFMEDDFEEIAVMDAGCGTGLTGMALKHAGIAAIDGFDIAPAMIEAAKKTRVYRRLYADIDLNVAGLGLTETKGAYDIVTSAGVFTLGHVAPEGLNHLIAMARTGGFVILSTRDGYLAETEFDSVVERLAGRGIIELTHRLKDGHYVGADRADYWVFRKLSSGKDSH